jgi:hypothetical protein
MLLLQCNGCGATTTVDCSCPPEFADLPLHVPGCGMEDLDAQVACKPGAGCCDGSAHPGTSHGRAASACARDHSADPCPEPSTCPGWAGMVRDVAQLNPDNPAHQAIRAELEARYGRPITGDCPGGHCHKDIDGCAVCRPITVTLLAGSAVIRPAGH